MANVLQKVCLLGVLAHVLNGQGSLDVLSPLVAIAVLSEEEERVKKRRRMENWWDAGLLKRAPVLSNAHSYNGPPLLFGRASNYSRNHMYPLSAHEYYTHFRFCREDIPELVRELRIPAYFEKRDGNGRVIFRTKGEEALLMFLKVK